MTPLYLKDIGSVLVVGKNSTLSRQIRAIAALADPRQDVDRNAPHYTPGLSKAVQS